MSFYEHWVLPPLLDLVMRQHQLGKYRWEVVAGARGRVLEIGVGSGLNLTLYEQQVEVVFGLDPSERLLSMAQRRAAEASVPADLILGSATNIPLENASVDTIVMTWTLCSISDPLPALREMRRVLKRDGALLFVEHGLSPEPAVERWQHRLTPLWRHISGGCHPRQESRRFDPRSWLRNFGTAERICPRPATDDLHVRGPSPASSFGFERR